MRRAFTIQLHDTPKRHGHICPECCVQWECRLPCFIEYIVENRTLLGTDALDCGQDTPSHRCQA